jgi:putative hydrolase of the HAD superfamily
VFCRDVGLRKPYPEVFELAMERLGVEPDDTLFVGDDPRWDIDGAEAAGIEPLLIVRKSGFGHGDNVIRSLRELVEILSW